MTALRILVTGASGMLGAGVALALDARGDDVTVLQRRQSGLGLREVLADVADQDAVCRAAAGQDAVVHLAAKVDVTGQWADFEHANIDGTASVVRACRAAGVARLVHVSSPSVAHAGASLVGVGARAADPARARGSYARSKAVAERIALAADHRPAHAGDRSDSRRSDSRQSDSRRSDSDEERGGGPAVVAVRPHLVWGPGDTQLVARIVARARAGRMPVIGTGAPLIDTTYVTNAVEALVAAVDRCEEAHGQALVVSNGEPRPVAEIIASLCIAAGVQPPTRHVSPRAAWAAGAAVEGAFAVLTRLGVDAGDPPMTRFLAEQLSTAHWFDQRHTREVLQWTPRVSLDEGFAELAASYGRDRGDLSETGAVSRGTSPAG